jgi:hypothetical protein
VTVGGLNGSGGKAWPVTGIPIVGGKNAKVADGATRATATAAARAKADRVMEAS